MVLVAWIQACVPKLSIESSMFISLIFLSTYHPPTIHHWDPPTGPPVGSSSEYFRTLHPDTWDAKVEKIQPQDSWVNMG